MGEIQSLNESDPLWKLFQELVETTLKPNDVRVCGLSRKEQGTDDEHFVIELCYDDENPSPINPGRRSELVTEARNKLLDVGEEAFPYFIHNLPESFEVKLAS
jgi:hypothetical protein